MTEPAPVAVALSNGVLTATLNRPHKRNALDAATIEALHAALDRADLEAGVRVFVLEGAGADFCAGADLEELLASADRGPAENEADALRLGQLFIRLRDIPKPCVALVRGRALAGGAGLALACDIVLLEASAQIGFPEVRRGFVPAMVMTLLRRTVGEQVGFELVATGRVVGAAEACDLGLASRVYPAERFSDEARSVLAGLLDADPSALALTKRLFHELDGIGFAESVALGARVNAVARETPGFRKAIAAFLAR